MAADKASIIELLGNAGDPIEFTVSDANNISAGDLLTFFDPRTASYTTTSHAKFAGVAARDKEASDGRTVLPVYTHGIFDLKISGSSVNAGDFVVLSGSNLIAAASHAVITTSGNSIIPVMSGNVIVGIALDAAVAATAETIPVLVNLGGR